MKKVKEGLYGDVFSAFILPYSKSQNAHNDKFNENMEFVGIAKAKWIDSEGESSRKIVAIFVDTKFLITNWLKKNEDNISGIIEIIEQNVGGVVRE